jgi:hypothetical protein
MLSLKGKGFFIWKVTNCENGDPAAIASFAQKAGLSHVLIKIANGIYDFNYDTASKKDLVTPVALALKEKGIQVWGWHYVFGDLPKEEAKAAIRQLEKIPLDGYVIDAESEYKDKYTPCRLFLNDLRTTFPDFPIALSSFRFPKLHPQLPWKDFLMKVDLNMPQVYWEQAHNPAEQLRRSISEFQLINPFRQIIPTGPAYAANDWKPSIQDINDFMNAAVEMNLPAINFYSWDYCRPKLPQIWDTIANFNWPGTSNPVREVPEVLIDGINNRNLENILFLYNSEAVHITAKETIQGKTAIRIWYEKMLNGTYKNCSFILSGIEGKNDNRHFSWTAKSSDGKNYFGKDSIGLQDGKIIYHYSSIILP